jgi:hypothetical protein
MASLGNLLPTFTANFAIELAASVTADVNTHWMQQRTGTPGLLANPVAPADTQITLTLEGAGAVGLVGVSVGTTLVLESEPMVFTAMNGGVLTVTRNVGPMGAGKPAPSHLQGIPAYVLKYPDPWVMIADEALRPWAQKIVTELGAASATFGARATGSLTPPTGA